MALMTCRAAVKQAEKENESTHSSISDNKMVETPKRKKMAPITRSAAARQAEEKHKFTHNSATDKKILVTPKRTTAPMTRSAVAKLAQQKEGDEFTKCRSTADRGKVLETPIIRNTYRRYGSRSRVHKPVAHNTKTKTKKKKKKPFHCIFCNKKAFYSAEPHPSCAVGFLDCMSCGAAFKFRVTANLACAREVQAALLAGGDIRWLSAMQGIVGGW